MNDPTHAKPFHYLVIYRAWSCVEVRADSISEKTYKKIRKTKVSKNQEEQGYSLGYLLYQKFYSENLADDLYIFGIDREGMIQVYELSSENYPPIEDLKEPVYENDGLEGISVIESSQAPEPNSIVASTVTAGKGVMGHSYLNLSTPFDPTKFRLTLTSGASFGINESAITSVIYDDIDESIQKSIDGSIYSSYMVKLEQFYCSKFDEDLNVIELFDGDDWIQDH